ncbi:6-carboxytetrahydropterin synthase [Actinocorallia sp. API 0066]|uniref:6-pyruvoyl trahydropterin synthase family protein n=1 Tax=Actinocorallia sp. API 0066 TaxID=2896846 RepID=UPI001E5AA318|nr:6-carboxytetrahydropterin synthase [Actinocorallia sp. API 0066]MCD0452341.1 6-carboxytetrahydropterin synthase [Actinocorallia sp. API 0066]
MLTITKEFHFSASHVLSTLPEWHPCARIHGHNYIVRLELSAPRESLGPHGFVRDYRDLDPFKLWLDKTLDHQHLNEALPPTTTPSAENLALYIYDHWKSHYPELTAVSISETPKTWATYRP